MNPLEIMLEEMNKSGISCEITRKNKHGVLEPVKESEVKALTTKSQIATTANLLTRLTKEEKLVWALETKDEGNELYQQQEYVEAMKKYVECLTATDFGNKEDQSNGSQKSNVDELVLPVLCNLAACCIQLQQWSKAVLFCQQALELRPNAIKALYRQGIAYVNVGEYQLAMKNFQLLSSQLKAQQDTETSSDEETENQQFTGSLSKDHEDTEETEENEAEQTEEQEEKEDNEGEEDMDHQQFLSNLKLKVKREKIEKDTKKMMKMKKKKEITYTHHRNMNQLSPRERKILLLYITKAKQGINKDKQIHLKQREAMKKAFQSQPSSAQPKVAAIPSSETSNNIIDESALTLRDRIKRKALLWLNNFLKFILNLVLVLLRYVLKFLRFFVKEKKKNEDETNESTQSTLLAVAEPKKMKEKVK